MATHFRLADGLHVERIEGECVIYNERLDLVHALDEDAAAVFDAAGDGASAEAVGRRLALDPAVVAHRLHGLVETGLLESVGTATGERSRRAVLAGSAALVAAGIVTVAAPAPSEAASPSGGQVAPLTPAFTRVPEYGTVASMEPITSEQPIETLAAGEQTLVTFVLDQPASADPSTSFWAGAYAFSMLLEGLEIGEGEIVMTVPSPQQDPVYSRQYIFTIGDFGSQTYAYWNRSGDIVMEVSTTDYGLSGLRGIDATLWAYAPQVILTVPVRRTTESAAPAIRGGLWSWASPSGEGLVEIAHAQIP